ncbi:MAG TPA: hypothetical protein P5167_06920 [Bacteroidales bacterium]|nr:hypothetical protein [Bacteroidales bacterium]
MKLRCLPLLFMLFLFSATASASTSSASVVHRESRFRTGQLPNGLTYYIQFNDLPKGQMHFSLVQKPDRNPFFKQVLTAPATADEGIAQLKRVLREQHVTTPGKYRPHLQGVILIGAFNTDSVEIMLRRELGTLPASVDVMQAQEVPRGIDSALAAKSYSAKPLPPVLQDGYPRVEIAFPLPLLPREIREGSEYFIMDFMRYVTRYAACVSLEPPAIVSVGDSLVWASRTHPDSLVQTFCNLSGACLRLAREGISPELYNRAREDYITHETLLYENKNARTNENYSQSCIEHFFNGTPVPSAGWRFRFVTEMAPYVTRDHVNDYIKSVMLSGPPQITLQKTTCPADSLIEPVDFLPEELLEERARLTEELSGMLFPFDDTLLMELAARILDIDLRLQLDSLERNRVIPVVNVDSLESLFRMVWNDTLLPPVRERRMFSADSATRGKMERQMLTAHKGVSVWQLSGGSLLYVRPDTLMRGRVYFAAVERDPEVFMPYVPQEVFRRGNGPLLWKQTSQGLLLESDTRTDSLEWLLGGASRQIKELLLYPPVMHGLWRERTKHIQTSRELSRTIVLDTLQTLLFDRKPSGEPSVPKGFDFVCTGDFSPDSLVVLAEQYLAGIPNRDMRTANPLLPGEGIRRGLHDHTIVFPNPAGESKTARVYSGPCPYTLEQYVLLNMLERLVEQATDNAVFVQSSLEYYPRGHYFLYLGFYAQATDFAYNEHRLDQVLADLAAFGPSEEQLENARHWLLVEHQAQLLDPAFHLQMLIFYSRSNRDFVTNYEALINQTDIAMMRDFVRQIMEYGNASRVVLSGATNDVKDASYSKNP